MKFTEYELGELGEIITGKTPKKSNSLYYDSNEVLFIKPDDLTVNNIKYISTANEFVSSQGAATGRIVGKGTVLITCIGIIGKIGIVDTDKAIFNQQINAIIPNENLIFGKYLAYVLHSMQKILQDKANAPIVPIINKSDFSKIKVRVPDLDYQKKVIEVLDESQKLINIRQSQITALDELTKSVFLEMFGDPKNNSKQLKEIPLTDLLIDIKGGGTPSKKNEQYYKYGTIPWVTPKDMKVLYIDSSKIYITEEAVENSSANYIQENSLLMVIRSGILKRYLPIAINRTKVTLNQDMKALIPDEKSIKVEYLYTFFKLYQDVLLGKVRSVTADNLDFNDIKKIKVPVAALEDQIKFKEKFNEIQKNIVTLQNQKINFEKLYNAVLQKAFKGELFQELSGSLSQRG